MGFIKEMFGKEVDLSIEYFTNASVEMGLTPFSEMEVDEQFKCLIGGFTGTFSALKESLEVVPIENPLKERAERLVQEELVEKISISFQEILEKEKLKSYEEGFLASTDASLE